jgi:hypothetical protein
MRGFRIGTPFDVALRRCQARMAGQTLNVAQAVADAPLGSVLSWVRRRAGCATRWLYGSTGAMSAVDYGAGVTGRAKVQQFQRFSNFCQSQNVPQASKSLEIRVKGRAPKTLSAVRDDTPDAAANLKSVA